jgi:hypothetical protein
LTITINGKTYNLPPHAGLFDDYDLNGYLLMSFKLGNEEYHYKEEHHTPDTAAKRIKKVAIKAAENAPTIGVVAGAPAGIAGSVAGYLIGREIQQIAKHFPKDEDSKEGYYNNGRLIQSGKKIYNK